MLLDSNPNEITTYPAMVKVYFRKYIIMETYLFMYQVYRIDTWGNTLFHEAEFLTLDDAERYVSEKIL